jgi:hypothetical protein
MDGYPGFELDGWIIHWIDQMTLKALVGPIKRQETLAEAAARLRLCRISRAFKFPCKNTLKRPPKSLKKP